MTVDTTKLNFSSDYRYERVIAKGTTNFSVGTTYPATIPTISMAHNLGYVPFYKLWIKFTTGRYYTVFTGPAAVDMDSTGVDIDSHYADSSNVYLTLFGSTNPGTVTGQIYYRIYAEPQT